MKTFKKTDFIYIVIVIIALIVGIITGSIVDKVFSTTGLVFMVGCGVLALVYGDHTKRKNKK